jgi:hypothetical protein
MQKALHDWHIVLWRMNLQVPVHSRNECRFEWIQLPTSVTVAVATTISIVIIAITVTTPAISVSAISVSAISVAAISVTAVVSVTIAIVTTEASIIYVEFAFQNF